MRFHQPEESLCKTPTAGPPGDFFRKPREMRVRAEGRSVGEEGKGTMLVESTFIGGRCVWNVLKRGDLGDLDCIIYGNCILACISVALT